MRSPELRDERFARRAFTRFLPRRQHRRDLAWSRGGNPPDYLLSCAAGSFDVEVTQVMTGVGSSSGETSRKQQGLFTDFARRLEKKANAAGILRGAYAVHLSIRDDLVPSLRSAESEFLRYIQSTAGDEAFPEQHFHVRGGPPWSIEKYGSSPDSVEPTMGFGARWKMESQQELAALVRNRLETKSRRLAAVDSAIVLLIDAYHLAQGDDWATAAASSTSQFAFHTVARVFGKYECQVLATKIPEWST